MPKIYNSPTSSRFSPFRVQRQVRHLSWVGKVVHDSVQQRLNSFVLQRRAQHDRRKRARDARPSNGIAEFGGRRFTLFEEHLAQQVVGVGYTFCKVGFGGRLRRWGSEVYRAAMVFLYSCIHIHICIHIQRKKCQPVKGHTSARC